MRIPLWAVILGAFIVILILVKETKRRDMFNEDTKDKAVSLLTDNPLTQFISSRRG